jgi:thiosulfate/3-mercaptopyruvate sulfurtransferase
MSYRTLISTGDLAKHVENPDCAVIDGRFSLNDTGRGYRDYLTAHIPGAVYAHLDDDLSGPVLKGKTGRHPLPAVEALADTLGRWGIDRDVQVVAYDDAGGAMAARLWWLLRWLGHEAVAVLDGGFPAWQKDGRDTAGGFERRDPRTFTPCPRADRVVFVEDVRKNLQNPAWKLVDSRTPERYRGEHEPIDPVAGRIPGALNAPHPEVIGSDGRFLSSDRLKTKFESLLRGHPIDHTVFYCGSGVSAAHNLLALAHAGLGDALLFAGSWSEWITDPHRPIATGP